MHKAGKYNLPGISCSVPALIHSLLPPLSSSPSLSGSSCKGQRSKFVKCTKIAEFNFREKISLSLAKILQTCPFSRKKSKHFCFYESVFKNHLNIFVIDKVFYEKMLFSCLLPLCFMINDHARQAIECSLTCSS